MAFFSKKLFLYVASLTAFLCLQSLFAFAQAANSGSVDLITEPISYTPPFYKGKPLFSSEGSARVLALSNIIINGEKASAQDLNFKWIENGTVLGQNSGIGKNTITIDGGFPIKDISIEVDILDDSSNVLASQAKILHIANPQIIFYENSPLYGILYNEALNNGYNLGNREELNIVAKPYFFSVSTDLSEDLDYAWSLNGDSISPNTLKNTLLLRQTSTSSTSGTASVSLSINNNVNIFQYTSSSFDIQFSK